MNTHAARSTHASRTPTCPPLAAIALAEEMATALAADDRGRRDLIDTAITAGQWLADQGRPGRWDTLDPKAILRQVDFLPVHEQDGLLMALVGLVGFAAVTERLPAAVAGRCARDVAKLAKAEVVRRYARVVAGQMDDLPAA